LSNYERTRMLIYSITLKVEIWDLKSAQKIVQLASSNPSNSSSVSNRGRDFFLGLYWGSPLPSIF